MPYYDRNGTEIRSGDHLRSIHTGEIVVVIPAGDDLRIIGKKGIFSHLTGNTPQHGEDIIYVSTFEVV